MTLNDGDGERDTGSDSETRRLRALVARQARELDALRQALATAQADRRGLERLLTLRQQELERTRAAATAGLATLREQLERVASSAAWRYGHAVTRSLSHVRGRRSVTAGGVAAATGQVDRLIELVGGAPMPEQPPPAGDEPIRAGGASGADDQPARAGAASRADELRLGAQLRGLLGPAPELRAPGSVSAIVVSRSASLAGELLDHLRDAGLSPVIVDNASPSSEVSELAQRDDERANCVRLEQPASFASACNRGAQAATGELLLFINDDVRPIEPGWLAELVAELDEHGDGVVGATLIAPASIPGDGGRRLEQRGITIGLERGEPVPIRLEQDTHVLDGRFGTSVAAPAVSAACMLIRADSFAALGGFDTGYHYGLEDVDLCLRARRSGRPVRCSGRAVVIHERSASQRDAGREFRRVNRAVNRRRFRRLWAPELRRERLHALLSGDPAWGDGPHLAIVRTSNHPGDGFGDHHTGEELGQAATALGWRVTYLAQRGEREIPGDLDVAVVLIDRFDARELAPQTLACAWVRNWSERWLSRPWLDRYDVLLASSGRSAQLIERATGRPVEVFPLAANPRRFAPARPGAAPERDWVLCANRWGTARAIEPALAALEDDAGAIYGRGWERVKQLAPLARGPIDYERLPQVYGSSRVVLDDTVAPALDYDAVNSRVFDALACGVPVLTNCEAGVRELFDADFPTWSEPGELGAALERLLADPAGARALGSRYRQVVLERHTYEHRARQLRRIVSAQARQLSFALKVGAPDAEQAERWGDLHFARALGRALRRAGHRWQIDLLPDWDSPAGSTCDVVVHLCGRTRYDPAPGQLNVLWLISHPDEFDPSAADAYDLVCVASSQFAQRVREQVGVRVEVLEQATDPRVFFHDPDPALTHELAFVGNSRGVRRKLLDDLLPTGRDLAVWGSGWEGTDVAGHLQAEFVANDQLRKVYSSASVVLCDHWPDMRAAGFCSNRVYDALACGALVVSDRVLGLDDSLGEALLTYEQPGELRELLHRLLADPAERARRTASARDRILAGETFDHRARTLLDWVAA